MTKRFQVTSMIMFSGIWASTTFANPSDTFIADCGDFKILSAIITDPSGIAAKSELSAVFQNKSVPLKEADRRYQTTFKTQGKKTQLFYGTENSEKDVYIEIFESPSVIKTFNFEWGVKSAVRACRNL